MLKQEINKQIKEIFDLQEQRVYLSNEFETSFKEYLLDAPNFDMNKLKQLCKDTSDKMNSISQKIIIIKNNFSSQVYDVKILYDLVEYLQSNEQTKFQLVKKTFEFSFFLYANLIKHHSGF